MLRTLLWLASVHSSWQLRASPCPVPLQWPAPPARSVAPPVCKVPRAFRAPPAELISGSERDGLVSKITDYGCFISLANENRMGLVHISTLAPDRLEKEEVPEFIESQIGPVGSKVRVKVMSIGYRGQKRISLQLIDVISKQHIEDMVFAKPGDDPREDTEWVGVDRYNDMDGEEEEGAGLDEEDALPAMEEEDFDDDDDDDDDDDALGDDLALVDPLEALSASGFVLQDGLQIEEVSDTGFKPSER